VVVNNTVVAFQWFNSKLTNAFGFPGTNFNNSSAAPLSFLQDFILVQGKPVNDWGGRPSADFPGAVGITTSSGTLSQVFQNAAGTINVGDQGGAWQQPFPSVPVNGTQSVGFINLGVLLPQSAPSDVLVGNLTFSSAADIPVAPYTCIIKSWILDDPSVATFLINPAAPPGRGMIFARDPSMRNTGQITLTNPGTALSTITYKFALSAEGVGATLVSH
jgi:hypothetical protein